MNEGYKCVAPPFSPSCKEPLSKEGGCLSAKPCRYKMTLKQIQEKGGKRQFQSKDGLLYDWSEKYFRTNVFEIMKPLGEAKREFNGPNWREKFRSGTADQEALAFFVKYFGDDK